MPPRTRVGAADACAAAIAGALACPIGAAAAAFAYGTDGRD
jgi:hypothetical protein